MENPRYSDSVFWRKQKVLVAEDEITHVLMWGTAGADARMGGSDYPTMVSTG